MSDIYYHHGKIVDGNVLLKTSIRSTIISVPMPKNISEINSLESALAYIIATPNNVQRVRGYKCIYHRKFHRFSFHTEISFSLPRMWGFDKPEEVIEFAKDLMKAKEKK